MVVVVVVVVVLVVVVVFVVVVRVVVAAAGAFVVSVRVRNLCYNGYLPQVKLYWLLCRSMNCDLERGRKFRIWTRSKTFAFGNLILHRYETWECKECIHVNSSSNI